MYVLLRKHAAFFYQEDIGQHQLQKKAIIMNPQLNWHVLNKASSVQNKNKWQIPEGILFRRLLLRNTNNITLIRHHLNRTFFIHNFWYVFPNS